MSVSRRIILSAAVFGAFASPALACMYRPPPPPYPERLARQRSWRADAQAIALAKIVLVRDRAGVFETIVALKGRPPIFQGVEDHGNADCTDDYRPEIGARAIVYFFTNGAIVALPLKQVLDPEIGPLLRQAAARARAGDPYFQAPAEAL